MTFGEAIKSCFKKYVTFSGRAPRSEYWWFALFVFIGNLALSFLDSFMFGTVVTTPGGFEAYTNTPVFSGLFGLATFLPSISVAVRRLHDVDRSGWWYWIALVPLIGIILLIVWFASKGTPGPNRFGPDPLDSSGQFHDDDNDQGYSRSDIPDVRSLRKSREQNLR